MIRELRIQGLGVIDEAVIEFARGMTALSGETGAGKTMITTGLGLLLGARAEPSLVRTGASKALVEGRFEASETAELDELGAEIEDDELLITRQITAQGRSRALLGGSQVTLAALTQTAGEWTTIHGQSEQIRLGLPERQREVLDAACDAEHQLQLSQYRKLFAHRAELITELNTLSATQRERAREADVIRFSLDEIAAINPSMGEDAELEAEAQRLHSLDELRTKAEHLMAVLSGADDGSDDPGAVGLIGVARKLAASLTETDSSAAELAEQTDQASYLINDLAGAVASYRANLEADPNRLEQVVTRQAELSKLTRKYGGSIEEVLQWAADNSSRLSGLEDTDSRIAELGDQITEIDQKLTELASALTRNREQGAARLQDQVIDELTALAMPHARLVIDLSPLDALGPHGAEGVQFLFSANPGTQPGPLAKMASGGELSRVRLALEVVLAAAGQTADGPAHTFVFDEVDAGVGGAVALEIGRRLARLADHAQVIVVTHLAQVAAFADRQWVIQKATDGQVTSSGVHLVEGAERESELARMMGGLGANASGTAHARELLKQAHNSRGASSEL